ncbi:BTAD domain-containing putative transcriptional regulator [Streptomyces sp. ME19-01-6]|uniref:AfsR/SARP family transcriptional regulator n=1 Tax=Streptomyces sp. ME19-01-6 TaxID=3028686 RepID=UPI0029B2A835|nr:BTAD domain-containing putative transcriptional regulator [Streptomyces sp. ME19-01-6]MDX3227932.1 BTAD domain-containing putative transcriptional regulator [Streptomyces sp. ME19-01-6]
MAALLLHANRVVSERQLSHLVWGNDPPPSVRGQIQVHVSELRKLLGRGTILRQAPGYPIVVGPGELDLHAFDEAVARARDELEAGRPEPAAERLRAVLDTWRGPALGGVTEPLRALEGPGLNERRLSALEDFFDARLAAGRHIHTVGELQQEVVRHPFRERLQVQLMLALHRCGRTPEALQVYADTRARPASEVGIEPGRSLRDTHLRLLRDTTECAADTGVPALLPAVSPAGRGPLVEQVLVPRQLPPDVPLFVGRSEQLACLDGLLEATATTVVAAIGGGPGVGKTSLAVHWAHRVRDRFPDGQLYLPLCRRGPDASALDPAEATAAVLEAFGVPGPRIPAGRAARFGLYRSVLAGRRVLIVLDDAQDADQVRPLLPGVPGCLVVVTSRTLLVGLVAAEGARPVTLDLLSASEAREFLAHRLGAARVAAEPEAADQLGEVCARLPLALAVVAARAATCPHFPLSTLVEELRDACVGLDALDSGDPATDLRAAFARSYRSLSPSAARLFRLLGLHPGPDVTSAGLLGEPVRRARALLAELSRAHLVTEDAPGRYRSHDLLRAYALELTVAHDTDEDRRAALHRLLAHPPHTAHRTARPFPAPGLIPTGPGCRAVPSPRRPGNEAVYEIEEFR